MTEIPVAIPVEGFLLEGLHERAGTADAAIICHPHPLYGGSMHNNVVSTLQQLLHRMGWSTLRFNFRGVGNSGGRYGEGNGEVADLMAAASYLISEGAGRIHLCGYSFGAWIALKAARQGLDPASLVLVSPPLDFLHFGDLRLPQKPCIVTLGDRDTFCTPESLNKWLRAPLQPTSPAPEVAIFKGCDHFYLGDEEALSSRVSELMLKHVVPAVS
jgi:alpha/beta superfamily hydrolase